MLQKIHLTVTAALLGGCIVLFILWQGSCNKKNTLSRDFDTLLAIHMRDSLELVDKINKLGQATVTAQAYELSQKDLDKYIAENAELKNKLSNSYHHVSSVNTTATNLHIDTVRIPVHDTLPCEDIDKSYPVVDKYYSFNFKFSNKSGHLPQYYLTDFNVPDTLTDVIGIKKSGFLNLRRTLVSEQIHSNKYIQIEGVQTIVKSEAKPRTIKKMAIGFGLGILTAIAVDRRLGK